MTTQDKKESASESTQNTQYDQIGTKYNAIKLLPAAEPEEPSIRAALGDITGKRCLDLACGTGKYTALLAALGASSVHGYDISSTMIAGAKASYPASSYPNLTFAVADCSIPGALAHSEQPFDIVFASWFLNYAGTETELTNMFRVVDGALKPGGRFVSLTTNIHDPRVQETKLDFYGLDVVVLDREYVAPDTGAVVGITARVVMKGDAPFQFDVYQFKKEVYERCAKEAGFRIRWCGLEVPDDERRGTGFWDEFRERATFVILEAERI